MASLTRWTWVAVSSGDGQGSLVYCSPWGRKEWGMTEWLNWTELNETAMQKNGFLLQRTTFSRSNIFHLGNSFTIRGTWLLIHPYFNSVAQSCLTLCDPMDSACQASLSITNSRSYSNSRPSSWWCHPTISSSVIPFSCLQSFPASGSFPRSQFFASGGQSIGAAASASVLPMNIQDWFPLGWAGWISLQSKGLSRVFFNTIVTSLKKQKNQLWGSYTCF